MPVSTPTSTNGSTNGAANGTSNGTTTTAPPVVPEEHHDKAVKVWQSLVGSRTISEDQVKDFYANWAETYEEDLVKLRSKYQRKTAERLIELIPADKKKTFEILDVACGTGLIGSYMAEHGITSIDGVDMSQEMLDVLMKRGHYRKSYCSMVGGGNKIEQVADNSYDAVIVSGGYAQAHMPVDSLREICRVIKPGGYFVNGMTEYYLKEVKSLHDFEPTMKRMEDEGLWYMISRESLPNMIADKSACIHIFRKK